MSRFVLLLAVACAAVCLVAPTKVLAKESKSVQISKPFASIYEYLDPKSNIIRQAKHGEVFELVYAGTSWYQVRVKDRVGWLERRAGEVVDTPPQRLLGVPVSVFIVFVVLMVVTLLGVAFVIYRQVSSEA